MTHVIDSPVFSDEAVPERVGVPNVASWVVPRSRVADRLDLGASGLLTLVTGPTGWGKTLGVASWAAGAELPGGLVWLSLSGTGADPDLVWEILRDRLAEAGQRHLAPIPGTEAPERRRRHALAVLGMVLRRSGPWVVVLDDYPTGRTGRLGRDLEVVLDHAQRSVRLVVISHGQPAIDIHRHEIAGELTRIAYPDLAMDAAEAAEVLDRHHVDSSDLTSRNVVRHTTGWPCGVRLAAAALKHSPTIEAAMTEADQACTAYLTSEVLDKTTPGVRELIVRTSMVEQVSPGLAEAVVGSRTDAVLDPEVAGVAFLELRGDGSFRCHPLLRTAALAELAREPREVVRESWRRATQWYVDRGETTTGVELAMAAEDWAGAARTLVTAYAVPRILMRAEDETIASALAEGSVRAAEPLLQAAASLRHGGVDLGAVLAQTTSVAAAARASVADRVSAVFIGLAVARVRDDATTGIELAADARVLMAQLPDAQQEELSITLDAYVGALELSRGETHQAALTLRHGATIAPDGDAPGAATRDCRGQLSLLEAFQGNLRVAEKLVALVLKHPTTANGSGIAHAHLAMAWIHLERAETAPARQHLDRASDARPEEVEPWFVTVQLLAQARLLTGTGQPEAALRLLAPALRAAQRDLRSGWQVDLLTLACAEALLVAVEPRQALDLVTPVPLTTPVEGGVLAASALLDLGDLAGAREALSSVSADLADVPLGFQVECWLLEARLADEDGHPDRAGVLVDRALRAAGSEMLRRPFGPSRGWLSSLADRNEALRRAHGGFLAGLTHVAFGHTSGISDRNWPRPLIIETLTVREAQVLWLLADMCSTEEIARELFLSVNTVKTYVRGILRKLGVNRRVDAVRRGRELGLC